MKRFLFAVALVAAILAAGSAQAAVIDFATGGTGATGTIVTSGGLITSGSGIALGNMFVSGLPALNGTWDTLGTGANSGADTMRSLLNGSAVLSFNVAARTFQIDGGIGCLDNLITGCTNVASVTPLVSGTLLSFAVTGTNQANFVGGNIVLANTLKTWLGITVVPPAWTVNSAFVINNSGSVWLARFAVA
jgi:hypothetical protein